MAYTTINKSSEHFNTKLYTGTDSAQTVTGVGFQPDFTWIKCRNYGGSGSFNHVLNDVIRGVGDVLVTNSTSASNSSYDYGSLASFNNDGFTTVAGGTSIDGVGGGARTYASWNWKANGTGVSNTDGTITSTVSANTTSGFSIVKYTGTGANATFGHGLGAVPKMYILKRYDSSNNWRVYHESIGNGKYMTLETTEAEQTSSGFTNNTSPTSSLISLGNLGSANPSGGSVICYAFAEKQGYSKFGSYTGNGSTDGTFVYTGFKPAFVIAKGSSFGSAWTMSDNKRDSDNVINGQLFSNNNNAEDTSASNSMCDYLSNGFKMRSTGGAMNSSGNTYIYMAFAEAPLVGTNGVTAKAR